MRWNKLLILLLFLPVITRAQKIPDMGLYKVRIVTPEKNITAEIKPVTSEPELDPVRFYSWYSSNHISQTQGGFSGKLLNGSYSEYYLNKSLKQQGIFDKGLKNGLWKNWNEAGFLISEVNWKEGFKDGIYELFDEKGNRIQKGSFKHGFLNGEQYNYSVKPGIQGTLNYTEINNYKNGVLVPPDTASKFWRRLNIFKKKK